MIKKYVMAALLGLAPLPVAFAGPGNMDAAWLDLEQKLTALVGSADQRQILDMAYAEVTASACPGFKVDGKAFEQGVNTVLAESRKKYGEQEMKSVEQKATVYYGVYLGFLISDSYADKNAFCKEAGDVRAKKGGPSHFWLTQAPAQ